MLTLSDVRRLIERTRMNLSPGAHRELREWRAGVRLYIVLGEYFEWSR